MAGRRALVFGLAAVFLVTMATGVRAQSYPSKPIRLIVPYTAGGPADIVARLIAQRLSESLGQQVIADNRGGASGMIGSEVAAKSAPDGYTILLGTIQTHAVNASLYSTMPYDPVKHFMPISIATTFPFVLVVHPSVPAKSVKELIDLAKSRPGQLNYASGGSGTGTHLAPELLKASAGLDIVHVPYKGGGQAVADVVGGQVTMSFTGIPAALPHVKAGKLRALAITGARRSPLAPELPTIAESGVTGYEIGSWNGVLAPAGTPKEIVAKLNAEIVKVLQRPDVVERLASLGVEPVTSTPAEFGAYIEKETLKWAKVIREAGIRGD